MLGLADVVRSTEAVAQGGVQASEHGGGCGDRGGRQRSRAAQLPVRLRRRRRRLRPARGQGETRPAKRSPRSRDGAGPPSASTCGSRWCRSSTIREQGLDVTVARHAASPDVAYAMFAGGGLAWAEQRMKAGAFRLEPAPEGEAQPGPCRPLLPLLRDPRPAGHHSVARRVAEDRRRCAGLRRRSSTRCWRSPRAATAAIRCRPKGRRSTGLPRALRWSRGRPRPRPVCPSGAPPSRFWGAASSPISPSGAACASAASIRPAIAANLPATATSASSTTDCA